MIHSVRHTKPLMHTYTAHNEQALTPKCQYDFSHLGAPLVFHSFLMRGRFSTPDSAVTHFLNLTGQLE